MELDKINSQVSQKVQQILGIEYSVSSIFELSQLGLDSMKAMALLVELEDTFDILYQDDELLFENFSTIQSISERIYGKLVAV